MHVGNMANKGTQALLKSDILALERVLNGDLEISVSTTDVEGVKKLNLRLKKILPPIVDIPYEAADYFARKYGFQRASLTYKVFALGCLLRMFFQSFMSILSATLKKFGFRCLYREEVFNCLCGANVVISCSDENFKESATYLPLNIYWIMAWWSMLFPRVWDVLCAKFLGKRIILFPNSVGPFRTWFGRLLTKLALNRTDFVLVRDTISYRLADSLELKPPKILTSDTAILLDAREVFNCDFSHPVVGVSPGFYAYSLPKVDMERYIRAHVEVLDAIIEKHGFSVIFLPHYITGFKYDDLEVCRSIVSGMRNKKCVTIFETDSVESFKSVLNGMDLVISSKMHPAVLAISGSVPTLCVAYDQKQVGFFRDLGLLECVISIKDFLSKENLLSKVEYVWGIREQLKILISEKVRVLQNNVINAIKVALKTVCGDEMGFGDIRYGQLP